MPEKTRQRAAHLGPERRRPMVLDASLGLFAHHGYAGTSMEMIAAEAGVTKPVVYECFENKSSLFHALLEREEQRLMAAIQHAIPADADPSDPGQLLRHGYTALLTAAKASPESWNVVFASPRGSNSAEPEIEVRLERARSLAIERIADIGMPRIESEEHPGEQREMSEFTAQMIVAIGESTVRLMLADPPKWNKTPEEMGDILAKLVMGGARAMRECWGSQLESKGGDSAP